MPGTKWRFDNHEYTCQEAIPPRLLSFQREDLEIEYRLSSSEPGSKPVKLPAPMSFFAKRELELLTKLQGATKNGATSKLPPWD
jgi:hypothetical protein